MCAAPYPIYYKLNTKRVHEENSLRQKMPLLRLPCSGHDLFVAHSAAFGGVHSIGGLKKGSCWSFSKREDRDRSSDWLKLLQSLIVL